MKKEIKILSPIAQTLVLLYSCFLFSYHELSPFGIITLKVIVLLVILVLIIDVWLQYFSKKDKDNGDIQN